jgi:site-specific recombinase XerD
MAEKLSYREKIDAERILQIRAIAREHPRACADFFSAIAVTTGTFTRLAYAIDLKTFFQFLQTERYQFSHKPLYAFTNEDLALVSQSDLTAYIEYLTFYYKSEPDSDAPVKALTNHDLAIKRKLCSIRSFYDYLFKNNRIPSNVTTLVPLPKIHEKPILRLSLDETQRMLEQAATGDGLTPRQQAWHKLTVKRDFALLSLFLGTGVRVSECVGLNIADVDLEDNAFLVTRKGGNQVVLYFPPEVAEALAEYMAERERIDAQPGHEEALFLSMQKRRITQRAVQNLVKKYAAVAAPLKPRISPHKLRSTFATNLYEETGDIYVTSDALGHSSLETVKKYTNLHDERRRKAAEAIEKAYYRETRRKD